MRHWLVLGAVYAVAAALVLPGSLLASEDADPAAPAAVVEEPVGPAATETVPETTSTEAELPAATTPAPEAPPVPDAVPPPEAPPAPPAAPAPPEAAPLETVPAEPAADEEKDNRTLAQAADTANVTIRDYEFEPATVTIVEGDTVTWTNDGPSGHSATATAGEFDTGVMPAGGARSETFEAPGTFTYICTPHPNMEGTVVVEAATSDVVDQEEDAKLENDAEVLAEDIEGDLLPATGKDVQAMIVLGLLMIALGAVLSLRARGES